MSLNLSLSYQEQSDHKALILTDTTNNYDTSGEPAVDELIGITLDTTFEGTDKVPVAKDQIDILAEFGPFTYQYEMVYSITAELLGDTPDSLLPDGLYALSYFVAYLDPILPNNDTLDVTILVYGQVKEVTDHKLRHVPILYKCGRRDVLHEILEADMCGAYLTCIETAANIGKTDELLNMLIVLEDITKNNSILT